MNDIINIARLIIALSTPIQPDTQNIVYSGYLSAYGQSPTDHTLQYRIDNGQVPPDSLTRYDGLVAVLDCALIGTEYILSTVSGDFSVIAFDCAGKDDGGHSWMIDNNIVAEIDWYLWQEHPEIVGQYAELTPP